MSMLIVASGHAGPEGVDGDAGVHRALDSARRQGFGTPQRVDFNGGSAWLHATPGQQPGTGVLVRHGARVALASGSFHWQGLPADQALARLLQRDDALDAWPWDELSGSFVLLLVREDGAWLASDALGLAKAYEVDGGRLVSTSMLACCAALPTLAVHRLRAQEYVLLGATHSLDTAIQGVRLLDPTQARHLGTGRTVALHAPQRLLGGTTPADAEAARDLLADALKAEFAQMLKAHGPNIGMPLSGGFDSRLLLATLDAVGLQPDLFVYGRPGDEDVQVATAIAQRLGRPIEAIDKGRQNQALPPLDVAKLAANLQRYDGLPVDGIFDRGTDEATRAQQVHGGRLNLNGGGGEILRNFFYLPDRRYNAAEVFSAFYSGWLTEVFHSDDERLAFVAGVEDEILAALGRPNGSAAARAEPLPRREVELVYTLFRLRYWMGRNNAQATRGGAFMTPLVTPALVKLAAALPLRWKEHGRLEAAVITRLSPRVAAGPSAYGFPFDQGPGLAQRLKTATTLYRPVWVRRHSVRVQKALGRVQVPAAPREWVDALGAEPNADWLNPGALTRLDQLNRLMTLQALLAQHHA